METLEIKKDLDQSDEHNDDIEVSNPEGDDKVNSEEEMSSDTDDSTDQDKPSFANNLFSLTNSMGTMLEDLLKNEPFKSTTQSITNMAKDLSENYKTSGFLESLTGFCNKFETLQIKLLLTTFSEMKNDDNNETISELKNTSTTLSELINNKNMAEIKSCEEIKTQIRIFYKALLKFKIYALQKMIGDLECKINEADQKEITIDDIMDIQKK